MNTPAAATISPAELEKLLDSSTPPRVVDVRTPAEFETAHITGSHNVPLDVLREHQSEIIEHLQELVQDAPVGLQRILQNGPDLGGRLAREH